MNRIRRSRLSAIAVVLLIPMILIGCNSEECAKTVTGVCVLACAGPCIVGTLDYGYPIPHLCILGCVALCYNTLSGVCALPYLACTEDPDECAATWEQMQTTVIQFCEDYPEECQQAFDTWVESLDEE